MSNSSEYYFLDERVERAQQGDRSALEWLLKDVQKRVLRLSLKFLWHPQDAEDAMQEILLKVASHIGSYRGEGSFYGWVYRIACNKLMSLRKTKTELSAMTWEEFSQDLALSIETGEESLRGLDRVQESLLVQEVRVACTQAMLLCMDRKHRAAYILGEILELDHHEASGALSVSPATYRKRLSRARADITALMMDRCGIVNERNPCRCWRRIPRATACGRISRDRTIFASSDDQPPFAEVDKQIRALEEGQRAAALYRSHPAPDASEDFTQWLQQLLERYEGATGVEKI